MPTGHQIAHKIRISTHLRELKVAIADARGKYGRDFIRNLPQGKLLDALDVRDAVKALEKHT